MTVTLSFTTSVGFSLISNFIEDEMSDWIGLLENTLLELTSL